jgi:hypothetical protein
MHVQPLCYTRILNYPELISVGRHTPLYQLADPLNSTLWVKACDDSSPGSTSCWLCANHSYTHITFDVTNKSKWKQEFDNEPLHMPKTNLPLLYIN